MSRLEQLEALLAAEPDDLFLNYSLALELFTAGRGEESLAAFDRVVELDPPYVAAYFHKGKTLLRMGDREGARNVLKVGIDQAQACGDAHAKSEMEELPWPRPTSVGPSARSAWRVEGQRAAGGTLVRGDQEGYNLGLEPEFGGPVTWASRQPSRRSSPQPEDEMRR